MTTRHPSLSSAPRPSSAIFIGLPPQPSPPSPAHSSSSSHSQLPSPPATNSGSTGDSSSTSAGSIRRAGMPNGSKHTSLSDDEDDVLEHDEDDTAKLSNERRSGKGKAADYDTSSSTLERVKSLTERNRKVIDKLSFITSPDSHSRSSLSTPSAPSSSSSRSRSPLPPTFSSSSSSTASTSSRVSFAVSPRGGSGSETEREQQHPDRVRPSRDIRSPTSAANGSSMSPEHSRQHTPVFEGNEPRQRLRSAPSSPAKLLATLTPNTPRKYTSTTFAVIGSGRRSRRVSIQQPDPEDEDQLVQSQMTGGSGNKKARAPLPREFRDRKSLDGRSVGEVSTSTQRTHDLERTMSPGVLVARGAASPQSSGAGGTFSATPASPRTQRPARPSTMRDSTRRMQRWNSVDEVALTGNGTSSLGDDHDGRRQGRHGGSAESPLGGKEGRSVVGEGLRAAGLARRGTEDVFAEGVPQRRIRLSGGLGSRPSLNGNTDRELEQLRHGITRVGLGTPDEQRDPRTPPPASGSVRYGGTRNIHTVLSGNSSRASTSLGSYGPDEEGPRTAPLRSYRSPYEFSERTPPRRTPQHERSHSSPYGRSTQHTQTPSSEHARLMLDSLAMFEAQLARIPTSSSAPDLSRVANSVAQSANTLNTLLRAGNAHALEAQIEAEVGDAAALVDASEVWRKVGGEYRESVRVSDELVRTVTALLLGVGRLVREAVKDRGTDSPDLGGGVVGNGRSSLDGEERSVKPEWRSTEVDGRRSVEGSLYRESRRSWEDTGGSVRRAATTAARAELNSRPSTSLSMTRDRGRDRDRDLTNDDDGEETTRERERSSALERLSIRRMFTPRAAHTSFSSQDSPDFNHSSPSPALNFTVDPERTSVERDRDTRDHRSLPPLSVPPPLPSLPSESVERKGSTRRRAKASNTSNATVRGSSIFPTVHSPAPTTAVSAHTVSAAGEVTAFSLAKSESSSGGALVELQEQQEKDVRKRSASITTLGSGDRGPPSTRVLRSSRVRVSFDGVAREEDHPPPLPLPPPVNGERRERRKTTNDLPS